MVRLACSLACSLAAIAVLVIALAYATSKALRAGRLLTEVEARFGGAARASLPRKRGEPLRRCSPADLLRPRTFDEYRREVDALLARAQALEEFGAQTRLSYACGRALAGGKRLRAIILLEVARAASARGRGARAPVDAGEAALFVEYLHSASLVIDDLPAFDNDMLRRGRPSLHAEVGPAVAQMAAFSLVAAAFQNVCRQVDWIRDNCPEVKNVDRIGTRICSLVSQALGAMGAAGGQYMDLSPAEDLTREHGADAVADLMYRKTATFFEIAVVVGWLAAGGEPGQTESMRGVGRHVGVAFQVADDIGDMARDAARAEQGKPGWNFANEFGRAAAEAEVEYNLGAARRLLSGAGLWTPLWSEIYSQVHKMALDAPAAPEPALDAPEPALDAPAASALASALAS